MMDLDFPIENSPAVRRLIDEVSRERDGDGPSPYKYNRVYNRHNR